MLSYLGGLEFYDNYLGSGAQCNIAKNKNNNSLYFPRVTQLAKKAKFGSVSTLYSIIIPFDAFDISHI